MLFIVAVRDRAAEAYSRPAFVPSIGLAMRSFQDEVNSGAPDNVMAKHPDDYDLYHIGSFDDNSGELEPITPKLLAMGKQVVVSKGN